MEMKEFFNLDGIFGDFEFNNGFMKSIKRELNEIENMIKNGKLKGKWDVKKIDEPGRKGYVIQGRFWSDQPLEPLEPFNPFEPLNPVRRRPVLKRPFEITEGNLKEAREPLTDVFEEDETVKIYVELPGEDKDDIQLNVTAGKVEVKAKNFYKMIDLPTSNVNLEKAASKYKNGVLEVTIPKNKKTPEKDTRKISID